MGLFGRLGNAFSAGAERVKFGGIQGVLKVRLKKYPIDSPDVQELISQATASAWRIPIVSDFFQRLGFSYEDFDTMYRAVVITLPDKFFGDNLVATSMMVDRCRDLTPAFRAIAEVISATQGNDRAPVLSTLVVDLVKTSLPKTATQNATVTAHISLKCEKLKHAL
jgi:hypothetical protein